MKTPKRRVVPATAPLQYGQQPNEVWCADFKGWFLLRNGRRCDPLTITDAASRYVLRCQALSGTTGDLAVRPLFAAAFREYGLPRAMRTDNGAPFASSGLGRLTPLSVWWLKLGIGLERIEPGCPGQNGRHERMHRELKAATQGQPAGTLNAQQEQFDRFRREYNEERPHEALKFAVPAAVYQRSEREMPEKRLSPMEYSDEWQQRQVRSTGQVKWKGCEVHLTRALAGERAGFEPAGDGKWRVWFGTYLPGNFDERKMRVTPPRRSASAGSASGGAAPSLRSGPAPPEALPAEECLTPEPPPEV